MSGGGVDEHGRLDEVAAVALPAAAGQRLGAFASSPTSTGSRGRGSRAALRRPADPSAVSGSSPAPTLIFLAFVGDALDDLVEIFCSTYSREPAQQHWPWLKKIALAAPANRASRSASVEDECWAILPPSSSVTFFRLPAAACTISLPTSVEPVKAILSTSVCAASAAPAVSPKPGTMLTTPAGKPGLLDQLAQPQRGERRLLGGLEHDACSRWPARGRASTRPSAAGSSTG